MLFIILLIFSHLIILYLLTKVVSCNFEFHCSSALLIHRRQWRTEGGVWGVQPSPPRNSEETGGDLHHTTKKNRRLDFLLQFTVFSYGCNLLNKCFF